MRTRIVLSLSLLMVAAGCGGGLPLAPVEGIVLLDGQPLPNATVRFIPQSKEGSSSIAETDADGKFQLTYTRDKSGAWIGKHKVRVNTSKVISETSGLETHIVEKVPDRYNQKTTLEYEVKSGRNTFELSLRSGGPISTSTNPALAPRLVNRNNPCD